MKDSLKFVTSVPINIMTVTFTIAIVRGLKWFKVEVKERLKASALKLMAEKGYETTSVRDICKEAKVNFNAITYHFGGKKNLFDSIVSGLTKDLYETPVSLLDTEVSSEARIQRCVCRCFSRERYLANA